MLLALIIITGLLTLSLIFALFCYMHYHLQRKDFEAYGRLAERNAADSKSLRELTTLIDEVVTNGIQIKK